MATHIPTRRDLLRWTGTGALAGMAAPLLGSCAGAPENNEGTSAGGDGGAGESGGDFTIYWNAGHAYETYDQVIAEFEEAHGITVNFQKYQWPDLRTRLLSDFASGTAPDLCEDTTWTQEFAISGDALSLQKYIDADGADMGFPDDWHPRTISRNSYDGEVYGIQLHLTCTMLFYNRTMLDDAGLDVPQTWDDLLEVATALTGDGVYGIALNQDASYTWPWLLQNGVRYYDPETGELMAPYDKAVEALQFQADLVHKHQVAPVPTPGTDYSGLQKLFSAQRAAMILTGPWDLLPIEETGPDLDYGIAPALTNVEQSTIQAGSSMFVPAKAKRPDLAWDFIKRITALEVETATTEEVGMLMPRKSWQDEPVVRDNDRYAAFARGFDYAVDTSEQLRLTGRSGDFEELFKTMYQDVVMNNMPAADALDTFVAEGQKLLAE